MSEDPRERSADESFQRGREAARNESFDAAIEHFLRGLSLVPNRVDAHRELRNISLQRKGSGGQALGFFETMKLKRQTHNPAQNMLLAEKLLSYDPGNTDHMLSLCQNAAKAGLLDVVAWIEPILRRAHAESH